MALESHGDIQVRFQLSAVIALSLLASGVAADPVRRVALVIGNLAYAKVPTLANPKSDARLIAQTLRGVGFTDIDLQDDL